MTKIYLTVSVKDEDGVKGRLPEENAVYFVNDPNQFAQDKTQARFDIYTKNWFDCGDRIHPSHWLEEVKIQSDEEIDKKYYQYHSSVEHTERNMGRAEGAKWMRDLILNNK